MVLGFDGDKFTSDSSEVTIRAEFTRKSKSQPAILFVSADISPGYHVYAVDQGKLHGDGPRATEIQIDNVSLISKGKRQEALLKPIHIRKVAFPDNNESEIQQTRRGNLVIMSDAEDLDSEQLASHLGQRGGPSQWRRIHAHGSRNILLEP